MELKNKTKNAKKNSLVSSVESRRNRSSAFKKHQVCNPERLKCHLSVLGENYHSYEGEKRVDTDAMWTTLCVSLLMKDREGGDIEKLFEKLVVN